jgi:hypothetical protein
METMQAGIGRELPRYKSHKSVWALKIAKLELQDDDRTLMTPVDEGYGPIYLGADYVAKHKPEVGGYYVVYADGYKSWSPAKAFEEGYTRA